MSNNEIKNIANKIAENPFEWVLVIGDITFGCSIDSKRKKIIKLAKKYKEVFSESEHFYDNIIREDYEKISDMIFGNVWDGLSFLDEIKDCQKKIREEYVCDFDKKDRVNIEKADLNIEKVLYAFPGIIMTICQDELFEAFWESRRSMRADERIWTPYEFSTSTMRNRWVKFQNELDSLALKPVAPKDSEPCLLVKLYGNCRKPQQMLLSSKDFDTYYPRAETETYAKKFLREIFTTKNIIFWSADTDFIACAGLPFAPGISSMLEAAPEENLERYVFIGEQTVKGGWEKYHMIKIFLSQNSDNFYSLLDQVIERQNDIRKSGKDTDDEQNNIVENIEEDMGIDQVAVHRLFWELYIRRAQQDISDYEKVIIEKILSESEQGWSKRNVYLLSMVANNQADFYDLRKIINEETSNQTKEEEMTDEEYYEKILHDILMKKLSKKNKILLCFLAQYGSGFPLGFFQLLSDDEEELKGWKRAGFQLTNSGIYIQRKTRKHLQKRMKYADLILETTYLNLEKTEVKRMLKEINLHLDDSYFYPLDESYFKVPDDNESNKEVERLFEKFLYNLLDILKDKRVGYRHIRSLLETEIYNIIKIIMNQNNQKLDYIPRLLFYLLHESKAVPVIEEHDEIDKLKKFIDDIVINLDDKIGRSSGEKKMQYYLDKVMAIMSQSILMSRSVNIEQLDNAIDKCEQAKKIIEEYEKDQLSKDQILNIDFFRQKLDILFLMSKIYGRKSTAIDVNRNIFDENGKKKEALGSIQIILDNDIKVAIKNREKATRNHYYELEAQYHNYLGKYFFMKSQEYIENIESSRKNSNNFTSAMNYFGGAEEAYRKALEYYEKYPDQYTLELADVMRYLGDLYYKKAKVTDCEAQKAELRNNGCRLLLQSYKLYRKTIDLHGIADVMLSFGNTEDFSQNSMINGKRSSLSFYDMAINLYKQLGDDLAHRVALESREKAVKKISQRKYRET